MRILLGSERPAEDQRQRHQADGGDVGALIEARQAGGARQRDPEILPEPLPCEAQLFDRGAQHVLDDHQPRVRRDDQAFRRDQAVGDVAGVLVQQGNRGDQLPD